MLQSSPKPLEEQLIKHSKNNVFTRFLNVIEKYGNKLPDPITILLIISVIFLISSFIVSKLGITVTNPATGEKVAAMNLLSAEGIKTFLANSVKNLVNFPPFGMVLVTMIGVGLAEASGLIKALMKKTIVSVSPKFIVPTIVFVSILGNATVDAALIVFPPMAAIALGAFGINPIVGIVLAYACVMGAYSANIVISALDVQLAGLTQIAAQAVDANYLANPAMNYYFIFISTIILVIVASIVTIKITIPRLKHFSKVENDLEKITNEERRGLRWAGISTLVFVFILLVLTLPSDAILRNSETGSILVQSPFEQGLITILTLGFFIPSLFYGIGAKTIRSDKDVAQMLGKTMSTMGPIIVLFFFAAQMTAIFNLSNLSLIFAVKGEELLNSINLSGLPLAISFILLVACVNLLMGSSSAKWSILAPIFVPMFMIAGYDPAYTQVLYRIGDSITNPIIPISPFLFFVLGLAKTYDPKMQLGTLISLLLPYSIFFALAWIPLIIIWFLLGIPLGPGANFFWS